MTALVGLLIVILAYPLALLFIKSFAVTRPGEPTVWAITGWVEAFTDSKLAVANRAPHANMTKSASLRVTAVSSCPR